MPNEKLRRDVKRLPIAAYKSYFFSQVRGNQAAVLHNGDLYPPDYHTVNVETWYRTDQPLTIHARLIPEKKRYWLEPSAISSISTIPFGSSLRFYILDPLLNKKPIVSWRNYEASYDVAQLEPLTPRWLFTYILQEYFIPTEKFDNFIKSMRGVLQRYQVNVVNISIRHTLPDTETYLSWAPKEVFSFVIYYKQATTRSAQRKVGIWTRALIEEALAVGGSYYLPYQIHASDKPFRSAYPGYKKFFALKRNVDPHNKFRNKLWDRYYIGIK